MSQKVWVVQILIKIKSKFIIVFQCLKKTFSWDWDNQKKQYKSMDRITVLLEEIMTTKVSYSIKKHLLNTYYVPNIALKGKKGT